MNNLMPWRARAAGWVLGLGTLLLTACHAEPEMIARMGFEDVHGWAAPAPDWLTNSVPHTGRWSGQLLATADFGPSFSRTWGELNNPKTIRVGGWVWLPHGQVHSAMTVEVKRGDESLYYRSLGLQEVVKRYNQWELVHQTHELPADLQASDEIKVYLWQWEEHYTIKCDDMFMRKLR